MLPAIVLILFCQGAITAAGVVLAQTDENRKTVALALAVILGIVPAWQTVEVLNSSSNFGSSFPGLLR